VRELENLIERAVVLSSGPALELDSLFPSQPAFTSKPSAPPKLVSAPTERSTGAGKPLSMEEVERTHLLSVLESTNWIIEGPRGAARALNVSPSTMRSRMKRLGISRGAV